MLVRVNDRVRDADSFTNQLSPQIGRGIDQQVPLRQSKNRAGSCSFVPRMIAGAGVAPASDRGNSDRGASAQQDQLAGDVGRERLFFQSIGSLRNLCRTFDTVLLSSIGCIWARNGGGLFPQKLGLDGRLTERVRYREPVLGSFLSERFGSVSECWWHKKCIKGLVLWSA